MKDQTERELQAERAATPAEEAAPSVAEGNGSRFPKPRRRVVLIAMIAVMAAIGSVYWFIHRDQETTDDAFIDGDVVPISPRIGGTVARIHFSDNDRVRAGDLLVEIDPRD